MWLAIADCEFASPKSISTESTEKLATLRSLEVTLSGQSMQFAKETPLFVNRERRGILVQLSE